VSTSPILVSSEPSRDRSFSKFLARSYSELYLTPPSHLIIEHNLPLHQKSLRNINMGVEPKTEDSATAQETAKTPSNTSKLPEETHVESEEDEEDDAPQPEGTAASAPPKKKKKSKKKRIKDALTGGDGESSKEKVQKGVQKMSDEHIAQMLEMNPSLAADLGMGNLPMKDVAEKFKKLDLSDIMTGLAQNGKNVKEMGSYKFWGTQPVPKLGENKDVVEGPFKNIEIDKVPKEPGPLVDGFEWVTMDISNDEELQEIADLLYGHYVEDTEANFRFKYSAALIRW
jgi:glycylpeptide N-tetradecanoyltransferase